MKEHLDELSGEYFLSYLQDTALPALLQERKVELGDDGDEFTMKDLLAENGLSELCTSTVYNYMHRLGYTYANRKKGYYVDSHEKPETKAYRKEFVKEYLQLEFRCHRWIQLEKEQARLKGYLEAGSTLADGHTYVDENGVEMIEFHVDDHEGFHKVMENHLMGGSVSRGERTSFDLQCRSVSTLMN